MKETRKVLIWELGVRWKLKRGLHPTLALLSLLLRLSDTPIAFKQAIPIIANQQGFTKDLTGGGCFSYQCLN